MSKTIDEVKAWLDNPSHLKCVLADISYWNGSEQTMRLSTRSYYDGTNEYIPIIIGGLSFSESLSEDLTVSISYGTIELENTGGSYDHFLDYIWKRRSIDLYLGDPSWPKSDFVLIFTGLVDTLVSGGESNLQITIVDRLEQLNETITTTVLKDLSRPYSAKTTEGDKLLPVLFGEVFNLSPILVDTGVNFDSGPWTAEITNIANTAPIVVGKTVTASTSGAGQIHTTPSGTTAPTCTVKAILSNNTISFTVPGGVGAGRPRIGVIPNLIIDGLTYSPETGKSFRIQNVQGTGGPVYKITDGISTPYIDEIIEVRDKGAPIEILTAESGFGDFSLTGATFGTITCSARSFPPADCTVPKIIKYIVKNYGKNKLTDSDIDFDNISSDRANYKVGIYITDRTNIIEVCNQLAKSINCALYYSLTTVNTGTGQVSSGKLKLIELKAPATGSSTALLDDSVMLEGTLQIGESFQVKPGVKLAYCKNYTQQTSDLALALNPSHGSIFKDEYWYVEKKDESTVTLYNDTGEVKEEITHLLDTLDANAEAQKRLDYWKTPRTLVTATYLPHLIFTQLGSIVTVKSTRFGLTAGKLGIVYSINRDWLTGFVEIGVLV